jgi:hypothetical protein
MNFIYIIFVCLFMLACTNSKSPALILTDNKIELQPYSNLIEEPCKFILGEGWSVCIPHDWRITESNTTDVVLMAVDEREYNLLLLVKQAYTDSLMEYEGDVLLGLKRAGVIINSVQSVIINNNEFNLFEIISNNIIMWIWITIHDEHAYALSCGGIDTYLNKYDECLNIALTLK